MNDETSVLYGSFFVPWEGIYSEGDTVLLRIYSGDSVPEKVIGEEVVYLSNPYYPVRSSILEQKSLVKWSMKDNYYRLNHPVVVGSTFFVGVKLVSSPSNNFALCHTETKSDGINSAFFKDDSGWHSFVDANPYYSKPTSLFIEPVVRMGTSEVSLPDNQVEPTVSVLVPNPVDDEAFISFPSSRMLLYYELVDMNGRLIRKADVGKCTDSFVLEMDCQPGVYSLRLVFDSCSESLKVVKK